MNKGFTLIELIVVIAILGILAAVIGPILAGNTSFGNETINTSWGQNGYVETRCMDGLKFTVDGTGHVRQVIGPNGGGVSCY